MSETLYPLSYSTEISYLRNKRIEEYDMASGGYSVTISEGLIEDEQILKDLEISNKFERQVMLGNYAKDNKEYVKELNMGFRKYTTKFITENGITRNKLLFIKKDSITFFDSPITIKKFNRVNFTKRESFTSMLKINKLEFYVNGNTGRNVLKGISMDSYKETLIEEIFKLLILAEHNDRKLINRRLAELRAAYINKELADSYYRELSSNNAFLLKEGIMDTTVYTNMAFNADSSEFFDVTDITYNYRNILLPIFNAMVTPI